MRIRLISLFAARLLSPVISFSANLLLLRYFGVGSFAVLATLLQGSLLSCVLIKRGQDDFILYRVQDSSEVSTRDRNRMFALDLFVLSVLLSSPFILSLSVSTDAAMIVIANQLVWLLQIALLGYLLARISVQAMRIQISGRTWIGTIIPSIVAPLSAIVGYDLASQFLPAAIDTIQSRFMLALSVGFSVAIIICERLTIKAVRSANSHMASDIGVGGKTYRVDLWMMQLIDVILLSGDLIMLGLLDRRMGLELYISACRLAVASAFITLAIEQVMVTAQNKGHDLHISSYIVAILMLLLIPIYVLFLYILGIRPGIHFDLSVLLVVMSGAAMQAAFLKTKVRWATAPGSSMQKSQSAITRHLVLTWFALTLTTCILSVFLLGMEVSAFVRAVFFLTLNFFIRVWLIKLLSSNQRVDA